jgi:hypothetical protein
MRNSNKLREMFSFGFIYRVIDSLILVIVLSLQNCTISYYLIEYNEGQSSWYFFFFADFLLVFLFIIAAIFASRHYRRLRLLKCRRIRSSSLDQNKTELNDENESNEKSKHSILNISFAKQLGTLPLLWICWLSYVLLLVIKIFILYLQDIAIDLYKSSLSQNIVIIIAFF